MRRDTGIYLARRRVPSGLYRMTALHGQDGILGSRQWGDHARIQANFGKKPKNSVNCTLAPMDPVFFVPLKGQSDAPINARTRNIIYSF